MKLSVIIINYNVKYFLEQCLYSVEKALSGIESEIIVIDNHSTDGSQSFFGDRFPGIRFLFNETNLGFAKGNNQALKIASGDLILFLNPDTIIPEDCFKKCIAFIDSNNRNYAIGIKMLDGSGNFLKESKRAFPSPLTSFYKLSGISKLLPHSRTFAKYHLGHLNENTNHEVDVLAGAFMMVPRKIIDRTGGFDEDFFMYGEDIDLSYRIQKAGFSNFYFAESSIIHFKGESTKKSSLNYVLLFYKAMSIFVKKHYRNKKAGLFRFFIHIAIFFRAGLAVLKRVIKWIGLPVIDAVLILAAFWIIKFIWNSFIKQEVIYSYNLLLVALPVFTILFLVTSYFTGLYDKDYQPSRLNKSTLVSVLVILSVYSLLPESLRFSRGILVFGSLAAFLFMKVVRWMLANWKVTENTSSEQRTNQTLVVGSFEEFREATHLLENAGRAERILGRVATDGVTDPRSVGSFPEVETLVKQHNIREIIFCQGQLSFKEIIDTIPRIPKNVSIQLFASGSHAIIGSDDKDDTGNLVLKKGNYRLAEAVHRRSKRLFDVLFSLLLLVVFPIHFFIKKRPVDLIKNAFWVLVGRRTWVGYSFNAKELPELKRGIITTTGRAAAFNTLPIESLALTDKLYAIHYHIRNDIILIWKNFHALS